MRTRRSTRNEEQPPPPTAAAAEPTHRSGSLADESKDSVGKLLKRAASRKKPGPKGKKSVGDMMIAEDTEGKAKEAIIQNFDLKGCLPMEVVGGSNECVGASSKYDANDYDWEEGSISIPEDREGYSHELGREVRVEFTDTPSSAQRKPPRRATPEEKELAELMHRVHLLCLLARGRLVDSVCDDRLIQASLLSLLPSYLLNVADIPRLTTKMLGSLVRWFHDNFRTQSQSIDRGSFKSNVSYALESREGTIEEITALSVALFRALNIMTRFVSILDVVSLKPCSGGSEGSNQDSPQLNTKVSSLPYSPGSLNQVHSQYSGPSASGNTNKNPTPESTQIGNHPRRKTKATCKRRLLKDPVVCSQSEVGSSCVLVNEGCSDKSNSCVTVHSEGAKRKGDAEFELQMEMALSATAAVIETEVVADSKSLLPSSKKMRYAEIEESSVSAHHRTGAVWSRKAGPPMYWAEVYCSGETLSGRWVHIDAVNAIVNGEDKVEASAAAWRRTLRYVVAFAGSGCKDVTRRYCMHWYKISRQRVNSQWWDSVLAPLKKLEADASNSKSDLDAFQERTSTGLEAKVSDVTAPLENRDPTKSYSKECHDHALMPGLEASKLPNEAIDLIPQVLQPAVCKDSLEDLELETRALTEPLPTNQLAYKNHHLYAIERWLTKNQTLHPKGPILGFCSGHPVYPRSCVQTLQSKQKWLREGFQVRVNEDPAKVVKRSKKFGNLQLPESVVSEEDEDGVTIELYGQWQLELLQLPHAVNGIVPKNERGQVEVWSEKCLPPGTVHLRHPRLGPVARRLEIDWAPAMVGFEYRSGRSYPIFEGIVVCIEFRDAILEAYLEEEERRDAEEKKRHESEALSRWYKLLSSLVTRQRLENSYGGCSSSVSASQNPANNGKTHRPSVISSSIEGDVNTKGVEKKSRQTTKSVRQSTDDHEHVYPTEDQSFDEENFIRTKRCPCGFSIQVEEL